MPGPIIQSTAQRQFPELPSLLTGLIDQLSVSPASTAVWSGGGAGEPFMKSLAKRLEDLIGSVLETKAPRGAQLPKRLRFSSFNRDTNMAQMHGMETGEPFEASARQIGEMAKTGNLGTDTSGVPMRTVPSAVRRLRQILDELGPEYNAGQYDKAAQNLKPLRRPR